MDAAWLNTGLGREFLHSLKRLADGLSAPRVDGHLWSKRDEIALTFWRTSALAETRETITVKTSYSLADRFLADRKDLLDQEKGRG